MSKIYSFDTKWIGKTIFYKEETDSTNEDMKALALMGCEEGTVVLTERQRNGKGRRGRVWQAEAESNLLFSLLLRPDMDPSLAPQLTILMALAVTGTLKDLYGMDTRIKWPNDVVLHNKKVCGILTEMYLRGSRIDYVVVGTGINVNQEEIPDELKDMATSLKLEFKRTYEREEILKRVLKEFEQYYEHFLETGNLREFAEEYNNCLVSMNKEVRVLDPNGEYSGISKGINENGELLVEKEDGTVICVYAGEVSVRGLYGYV